MPAYSPKPQQYLCESAFIRGSIPLFRIIGIDLNLRKGDSSVNSRRDGLERRERHRSEQPGRFEGPLRGVKRLVVDVYKIDLAHDFPFDLALVHIANAVGREVGDLEFKDVAAGLERSANAQRER